MVHTLLISAIAIFSATRFVHGVVIPRDNHTTPHVKSSQLQWGPCDPSAVQDPTLSCTFFEVPLDYHDYSVGNARLALVKANATGERKGTVFFNPGGPGGSGLSALDSYRSYLLNATGGVYDVVSWDPRGVGSLTIPGEIYCFDSVAEYNALFNGTIELTGIEITGNFTDPTDLHNLLSQAPIMQSKYEQTGQKCLYGKSGGFLKYVGTAATARDMVAMADAIDGVGALVNYIGVSYGTILGSWFVNMFPERVGKVIIDGVINPTVLATEEIALGWTHELTSSDDVYKGFITGCALAGPEGCSIASAGQTPAQVNDDIQALLQVAHDATRKNSSVPITSGEIRPQIFSALYSPSVWSEFANQDYPQVAAVVKEESGQSISRRFDAIRSSPLKKRQANDTNSYTAEAIWCGDSVNLRGTTMADVFESIITTSRNVIPLLGASWPGSIFYCSFWPERAVERYQGPFNEKLANKILVVGNSYDPITPFTGAQAVTNLLGLDQTALVRMNGFGHTSFADPSTCILNISQAYMVNGTLPEGGNTVCEVDADYEIFKGVNTADIIANLPDTL